MRICIQNSWLDEIHLCYPPPGHGRLPCDRNLDRIEKKRRKKDKVTMPYKWIELIRNTERVNPFKFVYVEHPLADDLKNDSTPVVKVKKYKAAFDPYLTPLNKIASIRVL